MENRRNAANEKKIRRSVLIMACGLLTIIMAFTGFVNYVTFAENYNTSLVNTYSVAGKEMVRKIEYALHYGKPLDNYYGMNDTLKELQEVVPEVEQAQIIDEKGRVLYDYNGFVKNESLPHQLLPTAHFEQDTVSHQVSYQFYQGNTYIFIGINDETSLIGTLMMVFPQDSFLHYKSPLSIKLIVCLLSLALLGFLLLNVILLKTDLAFRNKRLDKTRMLITLIAVMGIAQLSYSSLNYVLFQNAYADMAHKTESFLEHTIGENIASITDKGLSLESITGFEEYLTSVDESLPQIQDISLVQNSPKQIGSDRSLTKIDATVSQNYIKQQMFKILLDMLTVLVISIFFMIELTLLTVTIMTRGPTRSAHSHPNIIAAGTSHGLIRALIFFINMCAYMSITFVPIVMKHLYTPVAGLSKDIVLGLPLSAEMLGGILAILIAGPTINKHGWRRLFFIGTLFLALGNFLSAISPAALPFIFSRMIAGIGLGYILMTIRSLVVSLPENNTAIAEFGAGSIAGLNCGAVVGGMLADRIGYEMVFFMAAAGTIIAVVFVHKLMTDHEIIQRESTSVPFRQRLMDFASDRKSILFLLCIFIPYFVAGAFLDYFFPLFSSENGLTQSDISRGILLNGLFIIYLGPPLTRLIIRKLGSTKGMIVSMIMVCSALACFAMFGSIPAAFAAIILLGIAEGFGVSMKTTYFLNLRGIRNLEINKGIASFSIMVNFSRMAGPVIYGWALSFGSRMGVGMISSVILVLLLVFVLSVRPETSSGRTMMN